MKLICAQCGMDASGEITIHATDSIERHL